MEETTSRIVWPASKRCTIAGRVTSTGSGCGRVGRQAGERQRRDEARGQRRPAAGGDVVELGEQRGRAARRGDVEGSTVGAPTTSTAESSDALSKAANWPGISSVVPPSAAVSAPRPGTVVSAAGRPAGRGDHRLQRAGQLHVGRVGRARRRPGRDSAPASTVWVPPWTRPTVPAAQAGRRGELEGRAGLGARRRAGARRTSRPTCVAQVGGDPSEAGASWPPANQTTCTGVPFAAIPRALASAWPSPKSESWVPWTSSVGAVIRSSTPAGLLRSSTAAASGVSVPVAAADW